METVKFGPFDWLLLERKGDTALLITKEAIDMGRQGYYHRIDVIDPALDRDKRSNIKNMLDITWEQCDLRKVLHGRFLKEYFDPNERARIVEVSNENPDNPWFKNPRATNMDTARNVAGGKSSIDKVFLLSIEEVCRYFGDSAETLKNPTFIQVGPEKFLSTINGAHKTIGNKSVVEDRIAGTVKLEVGEGAAAVSSRQFLLSDKNDKNRTAIGELYSASDEKKKGEISWWLRSPGQSNARAAFVNKSGEVEINGSQINNGHYVRPALWLRM
jgi:hypothetical protein